MTIKELRDRLDNYIKHDPPDLWQLNDVDADAQAYQKRCKERENHEVVICNDGTAPRYFTIEKIFEVPIAKELMPGTYVMRDSIAISTNLTHEII